MKRSEAERILRSTTWTTHTERALLWLLLSRSDNFTCEIEAKYAPHSRDELARWAGLSVRQLQRIMPHLERHGWLDVTRGNGRGKGSKYRLVPREPDMACECPKGDNVSPIRRVIKGDTMSGKGRHGVRQRETSRTESPQVETRFQAREARTEEGGVLTGCDRCSSTPARIDNGGNRFCASCAPHLFKESA